MIFTLFKILLVRCAYGFTPSTSVTKDTSITNDTTSVTNYKTNDTCDKLCNDINIEFKSNFSNPSQNKHFNINDLIEENDKKEKYLKYIEKIINEDDKPFRFYHFNDFNSLVESSVLMKIIVY